MPELEIGHVDGGNLNFDISFLQFNPKKKYMRRFLLDLTLNGE